MPQRRPKVVIIVARRWRAQSLPTSGDVDVYAPNVARLASEGVHFSRAYATRPDSDASLGSLRTGMWPHASGGAVRPDFTFVELEERPSPEPVRYVPQQFHLAPNVPFRDEDKARTAMVDYYRRCTALDADLGRVLARLDQQPDTLVVFTSDRGDMLGAHGLDGGDLPYEESSRVPLIMRYPGKLAPGTRSDLLVSNADLMPTLLSLCGEEVPSSMQGRNLHTQIFEGRGDSPDSIYAYGSQWRMVVRGLDKMVVDQRDQMTHLFNLGQDPFEQLNRAEEPGYKRLRDEMRAHLKNWMRRAGDRMDPSGLKLRI